MGEAINRILLCGDESITNVYRFSHPRVVFSHYSVHPEADRSNKADDMKKDLRR